MRSRTFSMVCAALLASPAATASSEFTALVPNGGASGCVTCHTGMLGGEGWNDFGQDVLEDGGANPDANPDDQNDGYSGTPEWSVLCGFDSDGDGYDNGEELGDPDCVWTVGDDDPAGEITNPGDGDDFPGGEGGGLCAAQKGGPGVSGALALGALLAVTLGARRLSSRRS